MTTYLRASCHCASNIFKIPLKTATLPKKGAICHCNTCRHSTGQMGVMDVNMDGPPLAVNSPEESTSDDDNARCVPASLDNLTAFHSSSTVTRYFCTTCSAHMFFTFRPASTIVGARAQEEPRSPPEAAASPEESARQVQGDCQSQEGDRHWAVAPGVLERVDGIMTVDYHMFVGDTRDGGLADHYREVAGRVLPRYKTWGDDSAGRSDGAAGEVVPIGWKSTDDSDAIDPGSKNHHEASTSSESTVTGGRGRGPAAAILPFYCACKAVQFHLTRAAEASADPQEYWLVAPSESADAGLGLVRYAAAHCLCDTCRLTSGSLIQSWAVVPSANVIDAATGLPVDLQHVVIPETASDRAPGESDLPSEKSDSRRPKGLKQYESSPGKHREFCATCGATVFWWRDMAEGEPPHMDVSVGLVDEKIAGGARAEAWFAWYPAVMHREGALNEETAKALEHGITQ